MIALDNEYNIDEITSFNAISDYINDGSEPANQDVNLYKKTLDMLRSKKVFYSHWLKKAMDFFMKNGFEVKNGFYKAIIHDAFQNFPIKTAETVTYLAYLAQRAESPIEKRRALAIIIAYNKDLLQKVIGKCPCDIMLRSVIQDVFCDEKLVKLLLDQGMKVNQKQLKFILETNNLASIYFILSKKPFSLQEEPVLKSWFYTNETRPESYDFNSMTKRGYVYAKGICIPLLQARNTGKVAFFEQLISQNKCPEILALKESDEISKEIAQEDEEIYNNIHQICQNGSILYSEESIEKVSNFVEKHAETLQKNPNFLNCLLTKIQDNNNKKNQKISDEVNGQSAFCWPSIGIGPSAYLLYRSSCEDNFNQWIAFLGAGILAWSGWKTYAYYKNYQQLTRAIHVQEKTNKLEGYLTTLQNKKKLVGKNSDEQNKENNVRRQWPEIGSKIWGPLALGFFAIPALPTICKTAFKTDTQVGAANDKSTSSFLNNLISGLSFSAASAWLWWQNKNKFGSDDAQALFMSSQERGNFAGFVKIQEFKKKSNMSNDILKLTSNEN